MFGPHMQALFLEILTYPQWRSAVMHPNTRKVIFRIQEIIWKKTNRKNLMLGVDKWFTIMNSTDHELYS